MVLKKLFKIKKAVRKFKIILNHKISKKFMFIKIVKFINIKAAIGNIVEYSIVHINILCQNRGGRAGENLLQFFVFT